MRECGECEMCCTLLGVRELKKDPFITCAHCGPGCTIYPHRPKECKEFECLWLLGNAPEELKPSESHVVLSDLQHDIRSQELQIIGKTIIVYVDPKYPDAYKIGAMKDYLNKLLSEGIQLMVVRKDHKKHLYMKWGTVDGTEEPKE